jgi:YebC/PmpR family DNA-binding regulatory protein|tara:strand:+ start:3027 stop:3764 length:738 start_codon:yes stop_codon:yes gene_type:complete
MAGHSKWANIKHRKARQDASRGKVWTKVIREITVAAKGGPDPADNPRLRLALDKANASNMPKDNIKRAIQKGSGTGEMGAIEEITFEGYGPNGVAILVETMTDNRNRTVADVRHAFSKFGGNLGTDGSVAYLFNKLGVINIASTYDEDVLMEIVLEAGADDMSLNEDGYEVITTPTELSLVLEALSNNSIETLQAEVTMRADILIDLDVEASEKVMKIMDFMDDLDDVQEVHTNGNFADDFEIEE